MWLYIWRFWLWMGKRKKGTMSVFYFSLKPPRPPVLLMIGTVFSSGSHIVLDWIYLGGPWMIASRPNWIVSFPDHSFQCEGELLYCCPVPSHSESRCTVQVDSGLNSLFCIKEPHLLRINEVNYFRRAIQRTHLTSHFNLFDCLFRSDVFVESTQTFCVSHHCTHAHTCTRLHMFTAAGMPNHRLCSRITGKSISLIVMQHYTTQLLLHCTFAVSIVHLFMERGIERTAEVWLCCQCYQLKLFCSSFPLALLCSPCPHIGLLVYRCSSLCLEMSTHAFSMGFFSLATAHLQSMGKGLMDRNGKKKRGFHLKKKRKRKRRRSTKCSPNSWGNECFTEEQRQYCVFESGQEEMCLSC